MAATPITHTEIDHHGSQHRRIGELRFAMADLLAYLTALLHYDRTMDPGQQWTVPFGSTCGFEGRLIIQIDQLGSCAPLPDDEEERHRQLVIILDAVRDQQIDARLGLDDDDDDEEEEHEHRTDPGVSER